MTPQPTPEPTLPDRMPTFRDDPDQPTRAAPRIRLPTPPAKQVHATRRRQANDGQVAPADVRRPQPCLCVHRRRRVQVTARGRAAVAGTSTDALRDRGQRARRGAPLLRRGLRCCVVLPPRTDGVIVTRRTVTTANKPTPGDLVAYPVISRRPLRLALLYKSSRYDVMATAQRASRGTRASIIHRRRSRPRSSACWWLPGCTNDHAYCGHRRRVGGAARGSEALQAYN